LVHWPLMVGCYIWYSEEGPARAAAPPSPLLAVPNVTAHPSTASVPTSYYSIGTVSTPCFPILKHSVVVLDQKVTPTNCLNVVVIYTRNHLFQGACLDIVNIFLR